MKRVLVTVLLAGLAATAGHAALGETMDQLRARFGKPEPQTRKDALVCFFEVQDGRLVYTATFDDKGVSIAEGLKPLRQAIFTDEAVQDFINAQFLRTKDSKTVRSFKPGDQYVFGGKKFTCGPDEYVTVDDPNDIVLVWTRSRAPSIIAFRSVMVK